MPRGGSKYSKKRRISYRSRRRKKRLPNVNQMWYHQPKGWYNATRYAVKSVNLLRGLINSELHKFDYIATHTAISTPVIALMTGVNQGDDVMNRAGNTVLSKYLSFRVAVELHPMQLTDIIRVIIFVDNDNDNQTPTAAELLGDPAQIMSPINVDYSGRFTILYDNFFPLNDTGDKITCDKRYIRLDFHTKYTTGTGATGFGKSNIWICTYGINATNGSSIDVYSRYAFYDN